MKAMIAVAVGALALSPVTANPAATPCPRTALAVPAGATDADINHAEPSGHYQVGSWRDANEATHLLRWHDGVPEDLGIPANNGYAAAVDGDGQVVGNAGVDGGWHGWRLRDGVEAELPAPPGVAGAAASSLNARGEIAGHSFNADNGDSRPVVWSSDNVVRVLPRPDGFNEAGAAAIDDDGTVVGTVQDWDYPNAQVLGQRAVVWLPDGSWHFLAGLNTTDFTSTSAIRNGVIAGVSGSTPVTWSVATGAISVLPGVGSPAAVNAAGSVGLARGAELFLVQHGNARPLPVKNSAAVGSIAGVTDSEIVYGSDDYSHPVLWDCR
jgi:hypothetical protein